MKRAKTTPSESNLGPDGHRIHAADSAVVLGRRTSWRGSPQRLALLHSQEWLLVSRAAIWMANGEDRGARRNHIHTVVRTPNGNDYGKALLALHLALDH